MVTQGGPGWPKLDWRNLGGRIVEKAVLTLGPFPEGREGPHRFVRFKTKQIGQDGSATVRAERRMEWEGIVGGAAYECAFAPFLKFLRFGEFVHVATAQLLAWEHTECAAEVEGSACQSRSMSIQS